MQTLNKHIERRLEKLRANTVHLKRELWLLQRHVKEFRHPLFENWEADVLTRLIEVAHAQQYQKLPGGIVLGQPSFAERENLTLAYSTVAKGIRMQTLRKLGLSEKYHQALQRYPEVSFHGFHPGPSYLCRALLTFIRSLPIEVRTLI